MKNKNVELPLYPEQNSPKTLFLIRAVNIILSLVMVLSLMALWLLGMHSIGYGELERDLQHCLNVVMVLYFFAALDCSCITVNKITDSIRSLFK